MKTIYSKALKEALRLQISKHLPHFESYTVRLSKADRASSTMMPGEQVFVWKITHDFWVFVSFIPHRTQERFTADIGWSKKQQFPWSIQRPTTTLTELAGYEECMIDFADLLNHATGSGVFFGWNVWTCSVSTEHPNFKNTFIAEDLRPVSEQEARARSEDAATRAIQDIRTYAIPFIHSFCSRKSD